jgi:hypothetical protein
VRIVERDRQLVLTESRLGNAAAAAVTFAFGAPTFIIGATTLPISIAPLSNMLWMIVGGAVVALSGVLAWHAVFDERWVFDRSSSAGKFARRGYDISLVSEIERVEVEKRVEGQYEVLVLCGGRPFCVMSTPNAAQARALAGRLAAFLEKSVRDPTSPA